MEKPKICFVCPHVYPLFNPQVRTMFGGWEVNVALTAKEMARRDNFKISILVADHGQPHIEVRDGVELISWRGRWFQGVSSPASGTSGISSESGNSPADQTTGGSHQPPGSLKSTAKLAYKALIPWRVRIVMSGLVSGFKNGVSVFLVTLRQHLSTVTRAIGHIVDEPVFPEMVSAYKEIDAHIFVVPGNSYISAEVAWFSRHYHRSYVMLAGSDNDFNPAIKDNPDGADLYGFRHAQKRFVIKSASAHIVQHNQQVEMARYLDCNPTMIPYPVDLTLNFPKALNPNTILWVGNTREDVKRPSVMLELIRHFPDLQFVMIVTRVNQEAFDQIERIAQSLPNLLLLSNVPFAEVEQYFAQAKVFVSTSVFEGFPNTFLQAGKYGIPIVSLKVDPNEMISRHGCGLLCGDDFSLLRQNIQSLVSDPALYARLSSHILDYVKQFHAKEIIIPQYEQVFKSILSD